MRECHFAHRVACISRANGNSRCRAVPFAGGRRAAGRAFELQLAAPPVATRNGLARPHANRRAPGYRFPFPAYSLPRKWKRETHGFISLAECRSHKSADGTLCVTPEFRVGQHDSIFAESNLRDRYDVMLSALNSITSNTTGSQAHTHRAKSINYRDRIAINYRAHAHDRVRLRPTHRNDPASQPRSTHGAGRLANL